MRYQIIVAAILMVLTIACGGNDIVTVTPTETNIPATATLTASPSPTATAAATLTASPEPITLPTEPAQYGPDNFPEQVNPLTGQRANDPYWLVRRPVAVKIQIFPRGQRPTMGVSLADIVYDYYQNNGMTRFHAIFYSQNAEQVGPIRSARLLDAQLISMYKTALAFGGADWRILKRFMESDFSNRLIREGAGNCPPMCRIDPSGFNFLVTNTMELTNYLVAKGIDNSRQGLNGMFFDINAPAGGQPGSQIYVRYSISSYNRWDYDASTGSYLRFQDTQESSSNGEGEAYAPMIDKLTGAQLTAKNVVILAAPHDFFYRSKSGLNEIVEIKLDGSGQAYAMRDGLLYEVRWNRPAKDSVLYLTFPDGTPFPFKPGNTWFQVVGETTQVTNPFENVWRIVFGFP